MGGFEQIDEGILAGEKIGNEDIDSSASINPLKIEKRPIYIDCPLQSCALSGTSVALSILNNFNVIALPNSNSGDIYATIAAPRGEILQGERLKVKIIWRSATTSGNARLLVNIKPAITGVSNLNSAIEQAVITAAPGSAGYAAESIVEFPPSIFNNNQIIGLKISRDPANSLDTLADTIYVAVISIEINGRC